MHRGNGDGSRKTFEQAQHTGRPFNAEEDNFPGSSGLLFEQAMAQTRMAVCLSDPHQPDQPIVFANRAFRRLTGYEEEEILGRNCRFLQGAKTDRDAVARVREAIGTGR